MFNHKRKENGSVTIEATISLTAFMFAIITILTIVNICIVQARIANAINTTAMEVSQFSYLYSLTGFPESEGKLAKAGRESGDKIGSMLSDINTVFNEVENLGETGNVSEDDIPDISGAWSEAVGSAEAIEAAGSSLENTFMEIAENPKQLIFGIAKLAASESLEAVKSAVAAPLFKAMSSRHLVNKQGGDPEEYLKHLGVVPDASGSYMGGLDFSNSALFPYGTGIIVINVSYDVKVIALLPIDFTFHFNQTAITHGWLAGDKLGDNSSGSGTPSGG